MDLTFFSGIESALAMMGCFGKMPTHLVREITRYKTDGDYDMTTLTYQIQDGRPVKIDYTAVNPESTDLDYGKYTFEWN